MAKVIEQLWNGNLAPIKNLGDKNPEIKQIETIILNRCRELLEALDQDSIKILEKYVFYINEYLSLITNEAFCDGFSLGTQFTVEALFGAEEIMRS